MQTGKERVKLSKYQYEEHAAEAITKDASAIAAEVGYIRGFPRFSL